MEGSDNGSIGDRKTRPTQFDPELDRLRGAVQRRLFGGAVAPTKIGRHSLLEQIGAGGMGVVYAAYDPQLDRKVAIKLVRPDRSPQSDGSDGQARLLREAQALARVRHENVITVYDTGTHDEQVFLVMEFVEGVNLRKWAKAREPQWDEILGVYLGAGRGLAAAHRDGVVHRDFKPENALVGTDGRVLVLDFGLARAATLEPGEESSGSHDSGSSDAMLEHSVRLSSVLTREGAVLGTPAYMAPEQQRGRSEPAADQFSFCVALFEALFKVRPFAGSSTKARGKAIEAGEIRPIPSGSPVPTSIRRALSRGLAYDPKARFPAMDQLLDALELQPRRRYWLVPASAVMLAGAAAAGALVTRDQPPACDTGGQRLAGVWDDGQRSEIAAAFAATELSYAADTWSRVEPVLDRYATSWLQMHKDACEATWVRREQTEQMLGLRMLCLDERLAGLSTLTGLFAHADRRLVDRSASAAYGLEPLADCADAEKIGGDLGDVQDPQQREAVAAVRKRATQVRMRVKAGQHREALKESRELVEQAQRAGHVATLADVTTLLGNMMRIEVMQRGGDPEEARRVSLEGAKLARQAGLDRTEVKAIGDLLTTVGDEGQDPSHAIALATLAQGTIARGHVDGQTHAALLNSLAIVLAQADRYEEARPYFERSLALRRELLSADDPAVAKALSNLALVQARTGQSDLALKSLQEAVAIKVTAFGPHHPETAHSINNIGVALDGLGRFEDALEVHQRALEIRRTAFGDNDPETAQSTQNVGRTYIKLDRVEEGLPFLREAERVMRGAFGAGHPTVTMAMANIAEGLRRAERFDEALAIGDKVIAEYTARKLDSYPRLAGLYVQRGEVLLDMKRFDQARQAFARGREVLTTEEPTLDQFNTVFGLGLAAAGQGDLATAAKYYRQALETGAEGLWPLVRAQARVELFRALRRDDPTEASALAVRVRADLDGVEGTAAKEVLDTLSEAENEPM